MVTSSAMLIGQIGSPWSAVDELGYPKRRTGSIPDFVTTASIYLFR